MSRLTRIIDRLWLQLIYFYVNVNFPTLANMLISAISGTSSSGRSYALHRCDIDADIRDYSITARELHKQLS
jgi:hypothetical protein